MFLSQKIDVRHVRIVRISDCVQGIEPCGGMGKGHIVVTPSAAVLLQLLMRPDVRKTADESIR